MTDDEQPRSMRSGPPPPPVRRKPVPPPPPQRSVPPAPASAAAPAPRHQPPPPPRRSLSPVASAAPGPGSVAPARRSSFPPPLPPPPPIASTRSRSLPPPLPQAALAPLTAPAALEPWSPPVAVEQTPVVVVQSATQTPVVSYAPVAAPPPMAERATLVDTFIDTPSAEHAEVAQPAPLAVQAPVVEHSPIVNVAPAFEAAPLAEPSIVEEAEIVSHPAVLSAAPTFEPREQVVEQAPDSEPTAVIQPPPAFEPTTDSEPTAVIQPPAAELAPDSEQTTVFEREELITPTEAVPSEQPAAFAEWPSVPPLTLVEPAPPGASSEQPSFTSSGSEMPVVLETPLPHARQRVPLGIDQFWQQRGEWLPRAHDWSQKKLHSAPRALVVIAPFIALFGIWAGHSMVVRHRHAATVQASSAAALSAAQAPSPAEPTHAAPTAAPPAVLASVGAIADKPSTATPATPAAALADPAELVHALTHGLPALEALSAEFPGDAQVAVALATQQAQAQRFEAAVSSVQHALEIDPSAAQNGKVMSILWRAAQSPASEQTFLCLRKLGARGSDIAFDLATTPGVRDSVRERARAELDNFLAFDASADTRVATALLLAPDCTTRKGLLDRAGYEGGKRTTSMLERFSRGGGCASGSDSACNACMMGSPVLAHALSKLSAGAKP